MVDLNKLREHLGLNGVKNKAWGWVDGHWFTIHKSSGAIIINTSANIKTFHREIEEYLTRSRLAKDILNYFHESNSLSILISNEAKSENFVKAFLHSLSGFISNLKVQPTCFHCRKPNSLSFCETDKGLFAFCSECIDHLRSHSDQVNQLQKRTPISHGVVGSLVGGLLGAVLWIALTVLGWLPPIAMIIIGSFIAVGALEGYKCLKGRQTVIAIPILLLSTMLSTAFAVIISLLIMANQHDIIKTYNISVLFIGLIPGDLAKASWVQWIAGTCISIFSLWLLTNRQRKTWKRSYINML